MSLAILAVATAQQAPDSTTPFEPALCAVELPCRDVAAALAFYRDALAWTVERNLVPDSAVLRQGEMRLVLRHAREPAPPAGSAWLSLNVRVASLELGVAAVREHGGSVVDATPQPFALGQHVPVHDPAGHAVHLLTLDGKPHAGDPKLFNVGWHARELGATEAFWAAMRLSPFSRDFLPTTLPMQRHGAAAMVFHFDSALARVPAGVARPAVCFEVTSLAPVGDWLNKNGMPPLVKWPAPSPLGAALRLRDPDGLGVAIVERGPARVWFERLQIRLAGTWHAKSTKGWQSLTRYVVMASGSVLVEDDPQDSPANAMLSCVAMDGDRLLLTHYCHAGNAPRLVADLANATATSLTFTFLDGQNLPSRDVGHMDEVTFLIDGPDRFRAQWHWFQDGKQRPMEEVVHERAAAK